MRKLCILSYQGLRLSNLKVDTTKPSLVKMQTLRPPINVYRPTCVHAYIYVSRWARNLNFGRSLHLHTYMMNASCEGSGESALSECRGEPLIIDNAMSQNLNCWLTLI